MMKMNRQKLLVFVLVVIVLGAAAFSIGFSMYKENEGSTSMENQSFAVSGIRQISIVTDTPSVTIKPVQGDQVNLSWRAGELVKFSAALTDGELVIEYRIQTNWVKTMLLSPLSLDHYMLDVELPESYAGALAVQTASGSVSVYGALNLADLNLGSVSGAVDASDVASKAAVVIRSTSGSVHADAVLAAEDIRLQSVSGSVDLRKATALGGVAVQTTSGKITLTEVNAAIELSVKTTSGSAEIGQAHCDADMSFSSVSGSVRLSGVDCGEITGKSVSGSQHFENLAANVISLQSTSGSINGTISGAKDDYSISVHTVSGGSNLKSTDSGKAKTLTLSTVSGGVGVEFTQ